MFQKTKATTKTWFAKVIASFFHRTSTTCNRACNTDITSLFLFLCLIEIHSMQDSTANMRHGVVRNRSTKRLKHTKICSEKTYIKLKEVFNSSLQTI